MEKKLFLKLIKQNHTIMKAYFLIFGCFYITFCNAQEFETYENGLIYSPEAMERLKGIVGDKNEEFRVCDYNKQYFSIEQTKGRIYQLSEPNIKSLIQDLKNNIPLASFAKKYGVTEKENQLRLLIKQHYTTYKDKKVVGIRERPEGIRMEIDENEWNNSRAGNWVWNISDGKYVQVAYLKDDFSSTVLPSRYNRMIQYSECLIDTTSQIFSKNASQTIWFSEDDVSRSMQEKFMRFIVRKFEKKAPKVRYKKGLSDEEMFARIDSLQKWEKSKKIFVQKELHKNPEFKMLLIQAYKEALVNKNSNDDFEYYVANYISDEEALELKRNRIVVGQCSMDDSPRIHAMNIAQLAGESVNWDIFLRAHLNILNDNFNRVSDGSWAWAARETYIKELESLNIHVSELLLGISLRARNVAEGHYYGSIGRMGRAISESKEVANYMEELQIMIADKKLDDFNRLLMFYLYDNLIYHNDKSVKKEIYKSERQRIIPQLPNYLQKAI